MCILNTSTTQCEVYNGVPEDVCGMPDTVEWSYTRPLFTIIGTYNLLCQSYWYGRFVETLFKFKGASKGAPLSCSLNFFHKA